MTGCVALRKDIYYVRLSYYDKDHIRKDKFVSTGLSGRGAKQKAIIKKHSKDFGGSLEDPDVIKLCGCSRNSYYKYKKEVKSNI